MNTQPFPDDSPQGAWNALSCLCRVWQNLGLFAGMESTAFDLNGIVPTNRRNRHDAELSENRHEVSK